METTDTSLVRSNQREEEKEGRKKVVWRPLTRLWSGETKGKRGGQTKNKGGELRAGVERSAQQSGDRAETTHLSGGIASVASKQISSMKCARIHTKAQSVGAVFVASD